MKYKLLFTVIKIALPFLITGLILSVALAGVKKKTGYSVKEKVGGSVSNKTAQGAVFLFFDFGELALDAGMKLFHKETKKDDGKQDATQDAPSEASEPQPVPAQS